MAKKLSKAAKKCLSMEIAKHCEGKQGKKKTCKNLKVRRQAVAIGFAICRRKGFRSIPKIKR